jgi:catechol 2,3-dioxygenase-like lactoylglutathione lyase family enzyme
LSSSPIPQTFIFPLAATNIAIHEVPEIEGGAGDSKLDHLGFVIESVERVRDLEVDFRTRGVTIVYPFKIHRDGSASFYCADPDGVVIQILYEPTLSCQKIS